MREGRILVLEGLIGVGKSTLGRSLFRYFKKKGIDVHWMPEPINEKLLKLYLSNMQKYAFPFQVIVARERIQIYREAARLAEQGKFVIIDRGLPGDLAFAYMQKTKGFFTEEEFGVYLGLIDEEYPVPNTIIYLDCTVETAWKRILVRGIEPEKSSYNLTYLKDLQNSYRQSLRKYPHFTIDWNLNSVVSRDVLSDELCERLLDMCHIECETNIVQTSLSAR